jgi:hypothetical protein
MGKRQRGFAIVFSKVVDQPGVGPFLFVIVPGHITVCTQPNQPFTRKQLCYSKVKEGIAAHLYYKVIALVVGAARETYTPPAGHIADLFDCFAAGYVRSYAAGKILVFHFFN